MRSACVGDGRKFAHRVDWAKGLARDRLGKAVAEALTEEERWYIDLNEDADGLVDKGRRCP